MTGYVPVEYKASWLLISFVTLALALSVTCMYVVKTRVPWRYSAMAWHGAWPWHACYAAARCYNYIILYYTQCHNILYLLHLFIGFGKNRVRHKGWCMV